MLLPNALPVLFSLALLTLVEAVPRRHRKFGKRAEGNTLEENWVELPIDHFGDYNETYKNRYWYNATYYKAGGPVFLYDAGEGNAEGASNDLLELEAHSPVMRLAKRYNGVGIVWEHRYYGESLPFPIGDNTTEEQWQYLTVDQALEDVVAFSNVFSISHPDNHTASYRPHPNTTPWIFIGGSYPGTRAALSRLRNPETIYSSWSSSGPVQAQIDMSSYWKAAQRSLPSNCSNDWIAVTEYVHGLFNNGSAPDIFDLKSALIAAEYSGPGGNTTVIDQDGFLSADYVNGTSVEEAARWLMDPLGDFQYNGAQPIIPFCDVVQTQNFTTPAYTDGVYANFGIERAVVAFLIGIAETDPDQFATVRPPSLDSDSFSWAYQYCSEWGFYQVADAKNPKNIQTLYETIEYYQADCNSYFPWLKAPDVEKLNKAYGGWDMNPTHVMFTNGEHDPWRTLSIASFEDNAPNRIGNVRIPSCHTQPDPSEYFGVVYRGVEHCADLGSTLGEPSEPFYTSLALFQMALDEWLPCFGDKRNASGA